MLVVRMKKKEVKIRKKERREQTGRVKRRCESSVSVEPFEIFSQGEDLDGELRWSFLEGSLGEA